MANIDSSLEHQEVIDLIDGLLTDVTNIRTALVAITAKLDADAGVTDVDYNTLDPAALTTTT